ncbi:MAG: hypothetical protein ABFS86_02140 [Planctomycetota bacterium]
MRLLGHLLLIAFAAVVSWWFLLRPPGGAGGAPSKDAGQGQALLLTPAVDPVAGTTAPPPVPPSARDESNEPVEAPPPPESGTPEGDPKGEAASEPAEEKKGESLRSELATIAGSKELMERAAAEVNGEARKGFTTTFLCSARDQLAIAAYFDEPIVLVPRAGLDPENGKYFRLEGTVVKEIPEPPPLERFRQYRDLFAFAYESLPAPIRDLRRRVFSRSDTYLFAALIPSREWGLVIVRREQALAAFNRTAPAGGSRTMADVRNFTMAYERRAGGAFDIRVREIRFADGSRYRVPERP